jgi:S1-C subfamily serine protease
LAADHTIEEEGAIRVGLHDGRTVTASVAGREPGLDLAVLKVEDADLVPPAWIDHDALRVGHLVLAVGRPGKTARAALGILSALGEVWRTPAGGRVECYVQPDLALHPGFSGSLLVDVEGRALGMNSSGLVRGTAVALPTVTLRRVIDDLLAHGNSQRGFLGIGTIPVRLSKAMTEKVGRPGALLVVSVQSGSPAERAGMLLGDVLVRLGDKPIGQVPELLDALEDVRAGAQATAHVLRGGEPAEFAVTVGARTE